MKVKKNLIFIVITLVIGLIAFFNVHPIPTLFEIPPQVTLSSDFNGYFDSDYPLKEDKEAENRYSLTFTIEGINRVSSDDVKILDQDNKEQSILTFENDSEGYNTLWFAGKPNTKYKLSYKDRFSDTKAESSFTTPSNRTVFKEVRKEGENLLANYLKTNLQTEIYGKLNSNWTNISPYYTPTDEEKKAIADAYWDSSMTYTLEFSQADASAFRFLIRYKWSPPDMDELNKKINDREDQLKKEFKNDPKKVFKTVVSELPEMIKETPRRETEEQTASLSFNRDSPSLDKTSDTLRIIGLEDILNTIEEIYP